MIHHWIRFFVEPHAALTEFIDFPIVYEPMHNTACPKPELFSCARDIRPRAPRMRPCRPCRLATCCPIKLKFGRITGNGLRHSPGKFRAVISVGCNSVTWRCSRGTSVYLRNAKPCSTRRECAVGAGHPTPDVPFTGHTTPSFFLSSPNLARMLRSACQYFPEILVTI